MKKQQIPLKNSLLLLLTATIWGIAFVAQSEGGEAVGPLTFNATRNIIGSLVLIPVILLLNKINPQSNSADFTESDRQPMASSGSNLFSRNKTLIAGGIICGICLCLASNFQQFGIQYTSVGKAGFLTACYIIIVPILGLFMKKEMQSFYLGCGCNGTDWSLPALHHRRLFHWKGRLSCPYLCFSVFPAHSGH